MLSIRQAWHEILEETGINHELLKKAGVTAEHFSIEWIENLADLHDIRPDFEIVEKYKEQISDYIKQCKG